MSARANKRGNSSLVALGSAAVLAVYAAGFLRTQVAARRFADETSVRRNAPNVHSDDAASTAVTNAAPVFAAAKSTTVGTSTLTLAKQSAPIDSARTVDSIAPAIVPAAAAQVVVAAVVPSTPPIASVPTAVTTLQPSVVQAPVPVSTPPVAAAAPVPLGPPYHDGMFFGRGTSRHGDIEAMVEIKDGRIISASISQCLTRYSCSWIAALPPQVVARQSPDVDYVSGATQSANAFYYAVAEALSRSK